MSSMSISAARDQLPAVVEQASTQAVTLLRHGKPVAVLVSPARYEQLLEAEEEVLDAEAVQEALAEPGENIPWEQVKADLGWL